MSIRMRKKLSKVKTLETNLKKRIFGQNHIIEEVVDTLSINMAGLGDENKPIGSFLFTGPTGVGKTELAKELARFLDIDFERFDMSEYADQYSATNLIGSQKGLVGYEEGGLLTNAIAENPHCVLLLDEIEKADRAIYNTFLQVLDYGVLTDSRGVKIDFTNTIIIMTSNLESTGARRLGFGTNKYTHKKSAVEDFLTPEFRNRIDKIMEFNKITEDIVNSITNKFLDNLSDKLSKKEITFFVSAKAKEILNEIGFETEMGARSIQRIINNEFKKNISKEILFGNLNNGGKVTIDADDDNFIYQYNNHHTFFENKKEDQAYDFKTAQEASTYAKMNVGAIVKRASSGYGYIIKR